MGGVGPPRALRGRAGGASVRTRLPPSPAGARRGSEPVRPRRACAAPLRALAGKAAEEKGGEGGAQSPARMRRAAAAARAREGGEREGKGRGEGLSRGRFLVKIFKMADGGAASQDESSAAAVAAAAGNHYCVLHIHIHTRARGAHPPPPPARPAPLSIIY